MKKEHLPLTYIKSKKAGLYHVESSCDAKESGRYYFSITNEEKAKAIVTACNAYEDMLQVLKWIRATVESHEIDETTTRERIYKLADSMIEKKP